MTVPAGRIPRSAAASHASAGAPARRGNPAPRPLGPAAMRTAGDAA
ncbi:MAG: hypothetical protein V7637_2651 [Mycobacteriales bacterium]|jgi:hypothetical protein